MIKTYFFQSKLRKIFSPCSIELSTLALRRILFFTFQLLTAQTHFAFRPIHMNINRNFSPYKIVTVSFYYLFYERNVLYFSINTLICVYFINHYSLESHKITMKWNHTKTFCSLLINYNENQVNTVVAIGVHTETIINHREQYKTTANPYQGS